MQAVTKDLRQEYIQEFQRLPRESLAAESLVQKLVGLAFAAGAQCSGCVLEAAAAAYRAQADATLALARLRDEMAKMEFKEPAGGGEAARLALGSYRVSRDERMVALLHGSDEPAPFKAHPEPGALLHVWRRCASVGLTFDLRAGGQEKVNALMEKYYPPIDLYYDSGLRRVTVVFKDGTVPRDVLQDLYQATLDAAAQEKGAVPADDGQPSPAPK